MKKKANPVVAMMKGKKSMKDIKESMGSAMKDMKNKKSMPKGMKEPKGSAMKGKKDC